MNRWSTLHAIFQYQRLIGFDIQSNILSIVSLIWNDGSDVLIEGRRLPDDADRQGVRQNPGTANDKNCSGINQARR